MFSLFEAWNFLTLITHFHALRNLSLFEEFYFVTSTFHSVLSNISFIFDFNSKHAWYWEGIFLGHIQKKGLSFSHPLPQILKNM